MIGWYYYWYMPGKNAINQLELECTSLQKQLQALRALESTVARLTDENNNLAQICKEYSPVHTGSVVTTLLETCDATGVRLVRCEFKKSEPTRDIFVYRITGNWEKICSWWHKLSHEQGVEWGSYVIKMVQGTLMCKGVLYAYTHTITTDASDNILSGDPESRSV